MIEGRTQSLARRWRGLAKDHATVFKAATFGVIGFVNTAVDFGLFSLAYYRFGFPILAANLLSWSFAVSSSYVLNSMFTFAAESQRKLSLKTYATFVLAQLAGFGANTTTVYVASYYMPVLFGKMLATGVSFLVNFSLTHLVVFKKPADSIE
jgi:putative flippase GtrA